MPKADDVRSVAEPFASQMRAVIDRFEAEMQGVLERAEADDPLNDSAVPLDTEGEFAPPDLALRQVRQGAVPSRTEPVRRGRIDGNGRDLIRTTLRSGAVAVTANAEDHANKLADALEEHIVPEVPEGEVPPDPSVLQDDLRQLMEVLGIPTHARPTSPHRVMQDEILPTVRDLRKVLEVPEGEDPVESLAVAAYEEGKVFGESVVNEERVKKLRLATNHARARLRARLAYTGNPRVSRETWERLRRHIDRIVHGDDSPSSHAAAIMENVYFTLCVEFEGEGDGSAES